MQPIGWLGCMRAIRGERRGAIWLGWKHAQFVAFLADVVSSQATDKEIHVICDNVNSFSLRSPRSVPLATDRCSREVDLFGALD